MESNRREDGRIDTRGREEVRYWSEKLGVTPEQLKKAVEQTGTGNIKVLKRELNDPKSDVQRLT
jgi:hypothetical protein